LLLENVEQAHTWISWELFTKMTVLIVLLAAIVLKPAPSLLSANRASNVKEAQLFQSFVQEAFSVQKTPSSARRFASQTTTVHKDQAR
jgi:hypothetical protein